MNNERQKLENEIMGIAWRCVGDVVPNWEKVKFRPIITEWTFELRCSNYLICTVRLNPETREVSTVSMMNPHDRDKNGKAKPIINTIQNINEIEDYGNLMVENLKYYLFDGEK